MELHDLLDVILEYLKVLAWPAIVLTLALIFRRPIIDILERIQEASGWGAKFKLRQQIREVADDAETTPEAITVSDATLETAPPATSPADPPATAPGQPADNADPTDFTSASVDTQHALINEMMRQMLAHDRTRSEQRALIRMSWYGLEKVARRIGPRYGVALGEHQVTRVVKRLAAKKRISPELESVATRLEDVFETLRKGGFEGLTPQAANDFVSAADNIRRALEADELLAPGSLDPTRPLRE